MSSSAVFLLQALVIIAVPVVLLRVSGLKGMMPLVVMQIAVGIALGPSVFGRLLPAGFEMFASPQALASLGGLASVAVVFFGLISGLHLDPAVFKGRDRTFWPVAAANVTVPMALGCLAGYWILLRFPDEIMPGVNKFEFMAAIGICVSMKALPVLGAILGEMNLLGGRIGNIALGVAGVNDIVLWICLGALLTAAATGHADHERGMPPIYLLISVPTYLLVMIKVVRPLLGRMVSARMEADGINTRSLVIVGAATISSALATEWMGLHFIIGAFLVGAITPAHLHAPILERLQVMTVALLMPFFFALTGMRTMLDLSSPALLQIFTITLAVGTIGIVGGTTLASRLSGESWSFGFGLGALLQAKGLTELIVLTVLLDAKIVSPRIFAGMVLMALFSTALAMPLSKFALSRRVQRAPLTDATSAVGQRPELTI